MNIIIAIIVLSVIILVHEFGHFILAKANGVTVVEFSLGFGPKLLHYKKGETEYCIKLLPFGGACIMLGDEFENNPMDEEKSIRENATNGLDSNENLTGLESTIDVEAAAKADKIMKNEKALEKGYDMTKSFANQSVWARISILAAGPIFNFILAFILAVFIIGFLGYDPSTVNKVAQNSPAAAAGLQEGDLITAVNGRSVVFEREFSLYRTFYPEKTLEITFVRDSEEYKTTLVPEYTKSAAYRVGITITTNCSVNAVSKDSPAKAAGMKANDIIKSVDGEPLTNGTQFSEIVAETKDKEITVVVERDGSEVSLQVTPVLTESESYYTGLTTYGERVKTTPLKTLGYGTREVGFWVRYVIDSLGKMIGGHVSLNDVSGPVGIVNGIGTVVEQSKSDGIAMVILSLLNLTVMLSANLGVMNLLPIPALDGGRLVFCIIEVVRGKPVPKEKEGMVHFVGMILLMLLMVLILFNDIKNIFM